MNISTAAMQDLAPLPTGRTSLHRGVRLERSLGSRGCSWSEVQVFGRSASIESRCAFVSSSPLYHGLSSRFKNGCRLGYGAVVPKWRHGGRRVLCVGDEESGPEFDERGEEGSASQKVGSNYFSGAQRDEDAKSGSASATEFDAQNPFDLGWIAAQVDEVSERGMQRRRTFYSHDDWVVHRSSTRHYRHFASSFSSRAILSLIPPVGTVTAISVAVALYNTVVLTGWMPSFIPLLHAAPLAYQLTAPALALLLVFRTEASYSRYDEARKTWTKVISSSKDIARQSMAWAQRPVDYQQKKLLLDYILAFPVALKCHLLYNSDIAEELGEILKEEDLELVLSAEHRPNCLIQLITHTLKCITFEDAERSLLDASISQFNESISVCERLIRTPIPLAYTRLTSRILLLWHLALPVVLWDVCHWVVVPATFISAASLFCIEEVGVLIEEPFPILPLDQMCAKARENIQELAQLQVKAQEHSRNRTPKLPSNGVSNGVTRS
ncbi:hypothetical protein KC19_1G160500 [Ceratodon purpureus]|uniref:Uncharacterized protein n=1 Tax=Ceratodon purpureus TaxID=3225 RepID=A0A8T0J5Q3_CERPU|nr:hypothetical protein KC19_1G160500 [Ceratodon purpureus]